MAKRKEEKLKNWKNQKEELKIRNEDKQKKRRAVCRWKNEDEFG